MVKEAFILHLLYFMLDVRTALVTQVYFRYTYTHAYTSPLGLWRRLR